MNRSQLNLAPAGALRRRSGGDIGPPGNLNLPPIGDNGLTSQPGRGSVASHLLIILALGLWVLLAGGCGPRPAVLSDPTAPPTGYQRRIVLVVETGDFYPIAGAEIAVEVEEPTLLISPAGGRGRTDSQGSLELVFEPYPHYDRQVMAGGDIIADFPVKATVTVSRSGRPAFTRKIDDSQTFARYADPLYQGLNRDPVDEATHLYITVP